MCFDLLYKRAKCTENNNKSEPQNRFFFSSSSVNVNEICIRRRRHLQEVKTMHANTGFNVDMINIKNSER